MKNLGAALLIYLGLASAALAQTFSFPPPAGVAMMGCVYTTSPPTLLTATPGYVQCNATGSLLVAASITPSGTQNVSIVGPTTGGSFPIGATATTASAVGTTAATTATLAAVSSKFTYLCGFTITSDATAALAGTATVTGPVGGTLSFIQNVGAATAAGILTQTFNPCIPSSTTNTAIAVNSVAAGVGGNTAVVAWGYQQ